MRTATSIADYIPQREAEFQHSISLQGWNWNFKDHIKRSFLYYHDQTLTGKNIHEDVVKNIVRRIIELQKTERDIDVKDIELYVDEPGMEHLSFLVKKYYEDVFVVKNDIDTFIDEWLEQRIVYGGGLAKKGKDARPEIIPLESIAFCDQTNILKGPIAFKHDYNPEELKDMESVGWGSPSSGATTTVDELIEMARESREDPDNLGVENKTPGKYIEVYEVYGVLPRSFITDNYSTDYSMQMHICAFYQSKTQKGKRVGAILFRKEIKSSPLKKTIQYPIFSRALGFGGVEQLFDAQVWTNYSEQKMKDMLDSASKTIIKTTDPEFGRRNTIKDLENLSVVALQDGTDASQLDTFPKNLALFDRWQQAWETHAQGKSFANNPILGEESKSGVPFRAQERQVLQGKGPHEKEQGRYAKDLEAVYRDWFIPHIVEEVTKGARFLSELSTEELAFVAERVVNNMAEKYKADAIFSGKEITPEMVEMFKEDARARLEKRGSKLFLEILKGEFKNKALRIKINVKGKQKNLADYVDKLVNVFRQVMAAPQILQDKGMRDLFNQIIEGSGLNPVNFSNIQKVIQPQPSAPQPSPIQPEALTV